MKPTPIKSESKYQTANCSRKLLADQMFTPVKMDREPAEWSSIIEEELKEGDWVQAVTRQPHKKKTSLEEKLSLDINLRFTGLARQQPTNFSKLAEVDDLLFGSYSPNIEGSQNKLNEHKL